MSNLVEFILIRGILVPSMKSNYSLSSKLGIKAVIFWGVKTIPENFQKIKVVVKVKMLLLLEHIMV